MDALTRAEREYQRAVLASVKELIDQRDLTHLQQAYQEFKFTVSDEMLTHAIDRGALEALQFLHSVGGPLTPDHLRRAHQAGPRPVVEWLASQLGWSVTRRVAAEYGDLDLLRRTLVNRITMGESREALQVAIEYDQPEAVRLLTDPRYYGHCGDPSMVQWAFEQAVRRGRLAIVELLRPKVSRVDWGYFTVAATSGHSAVVTAVQDLVSWPEAKVVQPVARKVIERGHLEVLRVLAPHMPIPEAEDLVAAVRQDNLPLLECLLAVRAAKVKHPDPPRVRLPTAAPNYPPDPARDRAWIRRCLAQAAADNNERLVNWLLAYEPVATDHTGPAIEAAIERGHRQLAQFLIEQTNGQPEATALTRAACRGELQLVQALYENGKAYSPETVVKAAAAGQVAVVEWLVQNALSPAVLNEYGTLTRQQYLTAAMEVAVWHGQLPVAQWLAEHGAQCDQATVDAVVADGDLAMVKLLAEHGMVPSQEASQKAAAYGHPKVVRYLIERGRAPRVPDLLATAVVNGQLSVVKALLRGTDDLPDDLEAVAGRAVERGHVAVVRYLLEREVALDVEALLAVSLRRGHDDLSLYILQRYPVNRVVATRLAKRHLRTAVSRWLIGEQRRS